jgi:hypothetical protein
MCLCRSHYAKATKDQSYAEMNLALTCAQKVRLPFRNGTIHRLTNSHG